MGHRQRIFSSCFTALLMMLSSIASAQSNLDSKDITQAQKAFNADGFSSYGQYRWDNPLCEPNDYNQSLGRCVGQYQDVRLSIYPAKDAYPAGDYGHAFIHGKVKFTVTDIQYGEDHKWIGSTKYGEVYTIEEGYIFLPKTSFPPHVVFSKECESIRVELIEGTAEIVQSVIARTTSVGEIIVEYPIGYDRWHSRNPYLIESMCFVVSRAYQGKYQPYLGPLQK